MQAKDVICKGARWRVEDGSSIDIRKHRWLDSSGGGKILSPRLDLSLAVIKVCSSLERRCGIRISLIKILTLGRLSA